MKSRLTAGFSEMSHQLGHLVAVDAPNYTANFTASTLFFVVGSAACKLSDSPWLGYFAYTIAVGEAIIGARQWVASRSFFAKTKAVSTMEIVDNESSEDEEFHSGQELKQKKIQ